VRTRHNLAAARRPLWLAVCEHIGRHAPVSDGVGHVTAWDRFAEADRRACPDALNAVTSRRPLDETVDGSIVELITSVGLVQLSVSTTWPRWLGGLGGRREHGQVQGDRCYRPESAVPDGSR
jgi:hypothetical protein